MSDNPLHKPVIFLIADSDDDIDRLIKLIGIDDICIFTDPAVADREFSRKKPDILIFSFKELSSAEQYYFELLQSTSLSDKLNHRSVVLCGNDDSLRAYTLCSKGYFDDYVICRPELYDPHRIQIIVQHLLRDLDKKVNQNPALINDLTNQARQLSGVDDAIMKQARQGSEFITELKNEVASAKAEIRKSIENSRKNQNWLTSLFSQKNKIDAREVTKWSFRNIDESMKPLDNWVNNFNNDIDEQMQAINSVNSIARQIKRRILIIDDDFFQQKIAANILSRNNDYQIECASNWRQGLAILNDYVPDLIILDYQMPEISGLDLFLNITEDPRYSHIPFIMSTGTTDVDVVNTSFTAGASAYLVKPYKRNDLLTKVSQALKQKLAA